MDESRVAPTVGILACLVALALLALPYLVIDQQGAVATYYGSGSMNPLFAGFFVAITVIVFAAGRERRSDPGLASGAGLTFGLFAAVIVVVWAATVPESVVVGMSTATVVEYHRWLLAVVTAAVPGSGVWFARALGVF